MHIMMRKIVMILKFNSHMDFKRWWLVMVIFLGVGIVTPILGQSDLVFMGNDLSMTEMNTALWKAVFKGRYALWPNEKRIR